MFLLLLLVLLAAFALALAVGPYPLQLADVTHAILRPFGLETGLPTPGEIAFVRVRLPRVMAGLVVGAALSGAGATYQTLFRNPLVSPDILGVAAGRARRTVLPLAARPRQEDMGIGMFVSVRHSVRAPSPRPYGERVGVREAEAPANTSLVTARGDALIPTFSRLKGEKERGRRARLSDADAARSA